MRLVIASNNKGKISEIKSILGQYFDDIASQREAGLELDVEETGNTFADNAYLKAKAVSAALGCAALADDSGLCVDCLGGDPGVYSARYAGDGHDDKLNLQKLIDNCREYPAPRKARFVSAVALVYPDGSVVSAYGTAEGEIILEPAGEGGFGYDPVFYYPPAQKTFAQLAPDEKNRVSHRYNALAALEKKLNTTGAGV